MPLKLLIVGGVAGGATTAARARRLDETAEIILFERGEHISFANCGLPYYIGGTIRGRQNLVVTTPERLRTRFKIDVRVFHEVTDIDPKRKMVTVKEVQTGKSYEEEYDKLLLSPGAEPIRPPLPGIDLDSIFTIRNIPDTLRAEKYIQEHGPRSAVVVGGGYIGLEMAENLKDLGLKVTIVEMLDQILPPFDPGMTAIVQHHLMMKGVDLHLGDGVASFERAGSTGGEFHAGGDSLPTDGGKEIGYGKTVVTTQKGARFETDMVVLAIGVRPENELAKKARLKLGERGGIITDNSMRTSDPNIFAVGDVVEVTDFVSGKPAMIPLAGPANRQARIAADVICGRTSTFRGTQGTAILKVFDLTVASTGSSEKLLKKLGIPYKASFTHPPSHAGYYPGAEIMAMKLIFSPEDGKVLGAQIVGGEGVDKRIDVLATAIMGGMTVFDLEELELAYAPPYSSAKDPVNMAGFVASNILRKDLDTVNWNELDDLDMTTHTFLDVREGVELQQTGTLKGAVHIPIDRLRERLTELDNEKTYVVYCAVGHRGYVACRILMQHGFKCKNLSGGFRTLAFLQG